MTSERDPALDKAWRAHSREEPPAALDQAILAAAHRAAASGPRKITPEATRPPRWWTPLAAAAVIGVVAIGLIQLAPPTPPGIDTTSSLPSPAQQLAEEKLAAAKPAKKQDEAAEAPAAPAEARSEVRAKAKVVAPAPDPFPAGRKQEATGDKRVAEAPREAGRDVGRFADQVAAPAARPASPPAAMQEADTGARKDAARERQLATAPPPPAAAAPARELGAAGSMSQLAKSAEPVRDEARKNAQDPDAWIARIRKLREEGNSAEALRELREFRALVPDAERRLPADLREWKG